jgi:hypothetical protein
LTFTGAAGADAAGAGAVEVVDAHAVKSSAAAGTASQRAAGRESLEAVIVEFDRKGKDTGPSNKRARRTGDACGVLQPAIVGAGKSAL